MLTATSPAPHRERSINKSLLAETVYERLLADIIGIRYQPQERLNVDQIAVEFGVSRTPVREALILLSASGFVEVVRNSRTQVSAWTVCTIRDRLEVAGCLACLTIADPRYDLDGLVAALSCSIPGLGSISDAQRLLNLVESMSLSDSNPFSTTVLGDLLTPMRIFFSDSVLQLHRIDLAPGQLERSVLLQATVDAASLGARTTTKQLLATYVRELAAELSPRPDDAADRNSAQPTHTPHSPCPTPPRSASPTPAHGTASQAITPPPTDTHQTPGARS